MQPVDINHFQRIGDEPQDGDVLAVGEAVLERAKAVSRKIRDRVLELAGDSANTAQSRPEQ